MVTFDERYSARREGCFVLRIITARLILVVLAVILIPGHFVIP